VREVSAELSRRRPLAYTTVMTLLDRLARKGAVGRRKQGRSHVYHPLISREAALELSVDRLVRDFFEGSRERLVDHLQAQPSTPVELHPSEEPMDAALL